MLPLCVSFLQLIFLNLSITEAKHVLIGDNASIDENRAGSTYIVGGENATIEEVPYLVALLHKNWLHFGGGSIIKPNFILTSARCIYWHKPEWVTIRAGSTYYDKGGQVVKVAQISKHPKFVFPTWDYDVAVLLLEKNLEFGPAIKPIEVATLNEVLPEGTIGVISGWGITHLRKPSDYTGLRKVEVPKANLDFCKKSFAFLDYEITSRMTCYGPKEGGKDACRGDAGGPLAVNGKLVGIISWGEDCGDPTYPGVYSDLTHGEFQEYIFNPCAAE